MCSLKRNFLVEKELAVQTTWNFNAHVNPNTPKYMITFPYPYMNGTLHLGHGYTISKAEFMSRYKSLQGYNVIFPMAFHATGMPIVACANKLKEALVDFDGNIDHLEDKNQIKILIKMGVPTEELPKFVDPTYWPIYFSGRAKADIRAFGVSADLSRSFITTDINPYYDKFIRWQFHVMHDLGMLKFGKKHIIYSPKDGQPCADHDRSTGEGVGIKEFTVLKFPVLRQNYKLLVATTCPETFYRCTNLWMQSNTQYLLLENAGEFFACSPNFFRNFQYQDRCLQHECKVIGNINIADVTGVTKPSIFGGETIPVYHAAIKMDKGSGIVGSVPSHSVYDYMTLMKLKKTWVADPENTYDIGCYLKERQQLAGVISVDGNVNFAVDLLRSRFIGKKKLKSREDIYKQEFNYPADEEQLSAIIYKHEHARGIIAIGPYKNLDLLQARAKIDADIIQTGSGFKYYEPEALVVSRSNEECVVALTDQWFIDYGQKIYKDKVHTYLDEELKLYEAKTKNQFKPVVEWLSQWPCSRSYGLGTQLLETEYVIDSLSDSTIYMAYYTIAHLIEQLPLVLVNNELFDYLFHDGSIPFGIADYEEIIRTMKQEFDYWYPVDLRVSGKDLVGNHLTMSLFAHQAILPKHMPKSFYVNGHVMLNGKKMSKSSGNFKTLREVIDKYGADATRFALATAGTGMADANFTDSNADQAILKLTSEYDWFVETINTLVEIPDWKSDTDFWDRVFNNAINRCLEETTQKYEKMDYQGVIVEGFHNLLAVRDSYRRRYKAGITEMNPKLIFKFMATQLVLIYPICPHWVESLWCYAQSRDLDFPRSWPMQEAVDNKIAFDELLIENVLSNARSQYHRYAKRHNSNPEYRDPATMMLEISLYTKPSTVELDIIRLYQSLDDQENKVYQIIKQAPTNRLKGVYGKYAKFIEDNINLYGAAWFKWITKDNHDELDLLSEWIPKLLIDAKYSRYLIKPATVDGTCKYNLQKPFIKAV